MRIVFAGTPTFAQPCLEALINSEHDVVAVFTQPDRAAGRGRKLRESCIKTLAKTQHLPVFQPLRFDETARQQLQDCQADYFIVVAYGLLLPKPVLACPRLGCVNVHASLLPQWRGAAPIARAILNGDKQSGISIMHMEAGLDTGPVYLQQSCDIEPHDTAATLHDKLAALGAESLLQFLQNHQEPAIPQDDKLASYAAKLSKQEALIDWSLPAVQLARQVRAYNPWPLSHTFASAEHLIKIWQAHAEPHHDTEATPGTLLQLNADGMLVQCGQGSLQITRLQFAGGKPLAIRDCLNAPRPWLTIGTVLGTEHASH